MLLANDYYGNKIRVESNKYTVNEYVTCPICGEILIAKRGDVKMWHWAHKGKNNCGYKPETQWHLYWKDWADKSGHIIELKIGNHIADIITRDFRIIELQHSHINKEALLNRCYNAQKEDLKIDWIFDLSKQYNNGRLKMKEKNYVVSDKKIIKITYEFCISKSRQSMSYLFNNNLETKFGNVWFDLGISNKLFFVREMDKKSGYGHIINIKNFFAENFFDELQNIIKNEENEYKYTDDIISFNKTNNYTVRITFTSDEYKSVIYDKNYYGRCEVVEDKKVKTLFVNNEILGKKLEKLELNGNTFDITYKDNRSNSECKIIKV